MAVSIYFEWLTSKFSEASCLRVSLDISVNETETETQNKKKTSTKLESFIKDFHLQVGRKKSIKNNL